ncbi:hypothetical protein NC653_040590 [Populus alba x Populus x berolinensis]|uniref:Uncharacterized protein n=1 Tax=Populus alba x Populus x berolinensis TaxID=444605 RepID=A0AAD6L6K3_9ROSI|nr:hypothetical protein NC653_040590 [Populus alba x Populus x berolinensis]
MKSGWTLLMTNLILDVSFSYYICVVILKFNGIFFELEKKMGNTFFVLRTPFSGFCRSF